MTVIDPYQAIGLRCNPFIAEGGTGVPEALWIDRGFSTPPPVGAGLLLQIIGEKGAGKSSHLNHWRQHTGGDYCYFPAGMRRWKLPPVAAIAYWDEANRIPFPCLLWALRRAAHIRATIVAGTHADLSQPARQAGLTVQTIELPTLEVESLIAWTNLRIAAVQIPGATVPLTLTPEQAGAIAIQSGASWREAAVHLHIWAAEQARRFSVTQ